MNHDTTVGELLADKTLVSYGQETLCGRDVIVLVKLDIQDGLPRSRAKMTGELVSCGQRPSFVTTHTSKKLVLECLARQYQSWITATLDTIEMKDK